VQPETTDGVEIEWAVPVAVETVVAVEIAVVEKEFQFVWKLIRRLEERL
jgi:hypothetical protein